MGQVDPIIANQVPIATKRDRKMIPAQLLGRHTHSTPDGLEIHIWIRDGQFIARGRLDKRSFGETLPATVEGAEARLYSLMAELDAGTYQRPSERGRQQVSRVTTPRLTVRQLIDDFLRDKRKLLGKKTTGNYRSRLSHILAFVDLSDSLKRWPLARNMDRNFVLDLRSFLFARKTTPNGRPGATPKSMSTNQVRNVMECLRTVCNWASNPVIGKLHSGWVNPLTSDVVGSSFEKDPFRPVKLPGEQIPSLIMMMDKWHLCHLGLLCVLPPRPDEFTGLLISDVDWSRRVLRFGTRLGGNDFTKSRQSFTVPFPAEAEPLLRTLIGGRIEGPLFRKRPEFAHSFCSSLSSTEDMAARYDAHLAALPPGTVQTEQDRKAEFRRYLKTVGGITSDCLAAEFKKLLKASRNPTRATLYDLRHAVTQAMKNSGIPHIDLRYFTSHATNDILNAYTTIDDQAALTAYWRVIPQILTALSTRASELGIVGSEAPHGMANAARLLCE